MMGFSNFDRILQDFAKTTKRGGWDEAPNRRWKQGITNTLALPIDKMLKRASLYEKIYYIIVILFSKKIENFFQKSFSNNKKLWKKVENILQYFTIFYFSTWNLQNKLFFNIERWIWYCISLLWLVFFLTFVQFEYYCANKMVVFS